jgi:hypothetical protein
MTTPEHTGGSDGLWPHVTRDRPCPKCGHADWCAVSPDGSFARCYRVDDGTGVRKTDSGGTAYTLYGLGGPTSGGWEPPRYSHTGGDGKIADPDNLHRVYHRFLKHCGLTSAHRDNLSARGLKDGGEELGYRTLDRHRAKAAHAVVEAGLEEHLPHVPGFYVQERVSIGQEVGHFIGQ